VTDSKPSKSARKREHHALQALGEQLIELKESELKTVPMDENLLEAILDAQQIKAHGALRRQRQLIGKLMGHVDPEPIRNALAALGADSRRNKQIFTQAERWRDRISNEGSEAVDEFQAAVHCDTSELRRIAAELSSAPNQAIERRLRKQIFRQLHDLLAAQPQDV
jgi:ribosome-associated protein